MKKLFFLIIITFQFSVVFSKITNTQIEEAIFKIEYQLAKDYVKENGQ
jgi:hypothetical protein